jgi:putative spermidine/putrescine transport system permease protein
MKVLRNLLFVAGVLFPFLFLLGLSLAEQWRFPQVFPAGWTLGHWAQLAGSGADLGRSLLLSLTISLTVATTATLLGFGTSRHLAYARYRSLLLLLAYFPFVLAPVIYAAVLYFYFILLGLSGAIAGVMLAQLLIAYPYAIIVFTGYWNERHLAMAGLVQTLGGSPWQAFWRVLLPMSKGILLVVFFQTFLISWFEYGLTMLIGVGKVQTLTIQVFQYLQEADPYLAALSSVLLFMPPLLLVWFNKRYVFSRVSGSP